MIALALGTHRLEMPCWSGEMPLQPALVPCYRGDVTGVAMLRSADSMTSRGDSMTLRSQLLASGAIPFEPSRIP